VIISAFVSTAGFWPDHEKRDGSLGRATRHPDSRVKELRDESSLEIYAKWSNYKTDPRSSPNRGCGDFGEPSWSPRVLPVTRQPRPRGSKEDDAGPDGRTVGGDLASSRGCCCLALSRLASLRRPFPVPRITATALSASDSPRPRSDSSSPSRRENIPARSGLELAVSGREASSGAMPCWPAPEKTIAPQYFPLGTRSGPRVLFLALLDAANRGVRVRLLPRRSPSRRSRRRALGARRRIPQRRVRLFNPFAGG